MQNQKKIGPKDPKLRRVRQMSWLLLDDVGFAQLGGYGGLIQTPNLDSLAANGLRYINCHNNRKEYAAPFRFSDKLDKVVFELQPMIATAKNKWR